MAFMQSAGIEIKEFDTTGYVPGVASTEAAIGGVFSWGPIEDAELVSNENELVERFGKPTDDNFETFHVASNFLSYSNALYVSRAADAGCLNAISASGNTLPMQIKNDTQFSAIQGTIPVDVSFIARYAGSLGNSLRVAVCASAEAFNKTFTGSGNLTVKIEFTRDSLVGRLTVTDSGASDPTNASIYLNEILGDIQVGDLLRAFDPDVGSQFLKIRSKGVVTTSSSSASVNITFANRFHLSTNIEMDNVQRSWEYAGLVNKAPGTSTYTANQGGSGDELHIVVIDKDGKFTGIAGQVLEVYESVSGAVDARAEQGGSNYYKEVINHSSRFIYVTGDIDGRTSETANEIEPVSSNSIVYNLTGGADSESESVISLGPVARAYDVFKNPDEIDISIIISGKSVHGLNGEALPNYIIDNIVSVRKDCIVTISPKLEQVVNNPYSEAEALIAFRHSLRSSSYAFLTSAYKFQQDRYNDKFRWVPGCGDDAGLFARTDKDRDAWWSPAGHSRGVYKNLVRLAYSPDQADRDRLYQNDINPVVTLRGSGTILYGDKTLHGKPSAFDRINVRRLFIILQKSIKKAARELLFEFNDDITRARFRAMVQPFLRDVQGRRGIYEFKVVCDDTNNPGSVIDRNEFVGDIYIKPARSINYVTLNFVAVGTDVSFDSVVGQY